MNDALYAAALNLIEERGNQIVFGGNPNLTWGANEELGDSEPRRVEAGELVIDRRYWILLGKPMQLVVGFANEAGWSKWVGKLPPAKAVIWLEACEEGR